MNCVRCHTPLEVDTRFCPNCGLPVATPQSQQGPIRLPPQQSQLEDSSTTTQASATTSRYQSPDVTQAQRPLPPNYYPQGNANTGAKSPPTPPTTTTTTTNAAPRRRRSRVGCALGCFSTLAVLVIALGAVWVFALRPYIHNIATTRMDNAMTSVVNQIPSRVSQIPPGTTIPVQESVLNNLLVLNIASSDPVQNTNMQITPSGVRLDFKLYGQQCTITGIPQAHNGQLVATNVTVSGILSLFMSPADITSLLNKHLADAQARINRPITNVRLMNQELNLTLG